jgi:hypothetical protein
MNEPKIKTNKDWLIIAIFVLICAATWATTNTYHSYVDKKEVIAEKKLLTPLGTDIDQSLFSALEARSHLSEEELTKILSEAPTALLQTPPAETTTEEETIPTPSLTPEPEKETPASIPQEEIPKSQ